MSVHLFDMFISQNLIIPISQLQLVAESVFYIASKYEVSIFRTNIIKEI